MGCDGASTFWDQSTSRWSVLDANAMAYAGNVREKHRRGESISFSAYQRLSRRSAAVRSPRLSPANAQGLRNPVRKLYLSMVSFMKLPNVGILLC